MKKPIIIVVIALVSLSNLLAQTNSPSPNFSKIFLEYEHLESNHPGVILRVSTDSVQRAKLPKLLALEIAIMRKKVACSLQISNEFDFFTLTSRKDIIVLSLWKYSSFYAPCLPSNLKDSVEVLEKLMDIYHKNIRATTYCIKQVAFFSSQIDTAVIGFNVKNSPSLFVVLKKEITDYTDYEWLGLLTVGRLYSFLPSLDLTREIKKKSKLENRLRKLDACTFGDDFFDPEDLEISDLSTRMETKVH